MSDACRYLSCFSSTIKENIEHQLEALVLPSVAHGRAVKYFEDLSGWMACVLRNLIYQRKIKWIVEGKSRWKQTTRGQFINRVTGKEGWSLVAGVAMGKKTHVRNTVKLRASNWLNWRKRWRKNKQLKRDCRKRTCDTDVTKNTTGNAVITKPTFWWFWIQCSLTVTGCRLRDQNSQGNNIPAFNFQVASSFWLLISVSMYMTRWLISTSVYWPHVTSLDREDGQQTGEIVDCA